MPDMEEVRRDILLGSAAYLISPLVLERTNNRPARTILRQPFRTHQCHQWPSNGDASRGSGGGAG